MNYLKIWAYFIYNWVEYALPTFWGANHWSLKTFKRVINIGYPWVFIIFSWAVASGKTSICSPQFLGS